MHQRVLDQADLKKVREALAEIVREVLETPRDPARLRADVLAMRAEIAGHKPAAGPLDVDFAILRDGEKIGTHLVTVSGTTERRIAETRVKIVVKTAGSAAEQANQAKSHYISTISRC